MEQADALGRERYLKSGSGRSSLKRQLKHYFAKHPLPNRVGEAAWNATRFTRGLGVKSPLD
jgi:hypothetical protein